MSGDLEAEYDRWTNESPYAADLVWLGQEKKGVQLMFEDEEFYVLTKDGKYVSTPLDWDSLLHPSLAKNLVSCS